MIRAGATASALGLLALGACGTPLVGGACAVDAVDVDGRCTLTSTTPVSAPACPSNAACAGDEVCLQETCTFVGACVGDEECPCDAPTCTDHVCGGSGACSDAGIQCSINADCPADALCIRAVCQYGVECLKNADCPVDSGCFLSHCFGL